MPARCNRLPASPADQPPRHCGRLRASLLRLSRLTEAYCDLLLRALGGPADALGAALGIGRERAGVFTEAEVRASVVFQLSKLTTLMAKVRLLPGCSKGGVRLQGVLPGW